MPTSIWRVLALACIAVTLAFTIGDLLHERPGGTFGITSRPDSGGTQVVTAVAPGSAGAKAGIVQGDRISAAPGAENWYAFNAPSVTTGTAAAMDVGNARGTRRVTLIAERGGRLGLSSWGFLVTYEILRIVMIGVALLIVSWRPQRQDARALATFFIAFGFGFVSGPPWQPWQVAAALFVLRPVAVLFAMQQALRFATIFPQRSESGPRAYLDRVGVVVLTISSIAVIVGTAFGNSPLATTITAVLTFGGSVILILAIVAAFALGYSESSVADRPRMRWIALSILVGFAGLLPTALLDQTGAAAWWVFVPGLALIAIPIGVTYAMLRHRMFDVSFVISRALVFAILSAIVVLSFSALEWLVGKSLLALGHVQSVALEAALALSLGLSMDRLRGRVDHAVDNIFFRERHQAERALRRLAEECTYITSDDALVERTLDALCRYAQADGAALYFRETDGAFRMRGATMPVTPEIDENDPVVVSLRARRAPVDVNDAESAHSTLPGIIAFPMLVRGELSGILACGSRNGEAYDPDERHLLAALATALASAFATLESVELRQGIDRALIAQQPIEALRELRLRFG